jgi:hypothetical protein
MGNSASGEVHGATELPAATHHLLTLHRHTLATDAT